MTRTELKLLRSSIRAPSELMQNQKIAELSAIETYSVNCYAYALGIIVDDFVSFNPGFTGNKHFSDSKSLISCISYDLRKLKLRYRILYPGKQPIHTNHNEYLVKVYFCDTPIPHFASFDFHFVRRDISSKLWFHKWGWNEPPCMLSESADEIFEPNYIIQKYNNEQFVYKPICYFAIRYPT